MTIEEIEDDDVIKNTQNILNITYNYEDLHVAATRDFTVLFLEGDKKLAIRKLMDMKRKSLISDRDMQIFNTTEELLKRYNIKGDLLDKLRRKTLENYLVYKRNNEKEMTTISRDKVKEIVEGSFLLATKMLYIPVPRTRSTAYKEVLSKIGGAIPSRPSFHLPGLVQKVKDSLGLADEGSNELEEAAQKIAERFESNALRYVGKNDLAIAGAYIYVALKRLEDLPDITQREIGKMAGTTVPTIVDHVSEVRGVLERSEILG